MAKLITEPVTVTIEHGDTRQTYYAGYGSLSGDGLGRTNISVNSAQLLNSETKPKGTQWSHRPATFSAGGYVPTVSPQQTALIAAAKAQERATLEAARIVEKAQEQAEALINEADHALNVAIQAYLHTGKTTTEVARVFDGAGIYYNEVRGDNVATLNTEDLYLLDATELLTVG
jgi:hypothetical protein